VSARRSAVDARSGEAKAIVKREGKKKEMKELDEYQELVKVDANEPDIVQCLRFYACGTVASQLNTAIRISECGDRQFQCGEGTSSDELESGTLNGKNSSPKPTVEVVLEEKGQEGMTPVETESQPRSTWKPVIVHNEDECLEEAPPLPLSRVPSIVVNVSGKLLHLDGDSEPEQKTSGNRKSDWVPSCDVSITSIILPNPPRKKPEREKETDETEGYNEDEELELEEYIEKIKPNRGIRGLFSRFRRNA
jgi:hypothetical protein